MIALWLAWPTTTLFLTVVQAAQTVSVPSFEATAMGFAGVVGLALVGTTVKNRDRTREIHQMLRGSPGMPGLIAKVDAVHAKMVETATTLATHTAAETVWQADLVRNAALAANRTQAALTGIDSRLEAVEQRLARRRERGP